MNEWINEWMIPNINLNLTATLQAGVDESRRIRRPETQNQRSGAPSPPQISWSSISSGSSSNGDRNNNDDGNDGGNRKPQQAIILLINYYYINILIDS